MAGISLLLPVLLGGAAFAGLVTMIVAIAATLGSLAN